MLKENIQDKSILIKLVFLSYKTSLISVYNEYDNCSMFLT